MCFAVSWTGRGRSLLSVCNFSTAPKQVKLFAEGHSPPLCNAAAHFAFALQHLAFPCACASACFKFCHHESSACCGWAQTASKPEGALQQSREVVQLYRSPGLSASATKTLIRKVCTPLSPGDSLERPRGIITTGRNHLGAMHPLIV